MVVEMTKRTDPEDPWSLPELKDDSVPWKALTLKGKIGRVLIAILKALCLVLLLYGFVCSLDFLSSSFRLLGGRHAGSVMSRTELLLNPVVGLMLGVIATVLVQSSSTSTSIVITMVGSGLLQVRQAIPIIMGANIGTSVTNTLVSIGQVTDRNEFRRAFAAATVHDMFNWLSVIVLLPIEVATGYLENLTKALVDYGNWEQNKGLNKAFLKLLTKPFTSLIVQMDKKVISGIAVNSSAYANSSLLKKCCSKGVCKNCGYLLEHFGMSEQASGIVLLFFSLILLCACLILIVKLLHSVLKGRIAVILKKTVNAEPRPPFNYLVGYAAILIGCAITMLVQSSSVFTSALTPLAGLGVITTERMYPLTLGSNIGTTTTGLLAALAADPSRLPFTLQIAFCHLFFNLSGILLFYPVPFMRLPLPLAKGLGNITAKYRWFAVMYLVLMFIVLPLLVFGLSLAGTIVLAAVGIPLLVLLALVVIINIIQSRKPSILPPKLRNWSWLPECLHSLDPLDRLISKMNCCGRKNSIEEKTMVPEHNRRNGLENEAFDWNCNTENTKL